jgi:hypothetical protein
MSEARTRMTLRLESVTAERLQRWMAAHRVSTKTEAIHRLLNYALDSAGIVKRPKVTSGN